MLMKRMLNRLGCVVDVAENGQAALDALSASSASPTSPVRSVSHPLPTPSSDSHASAGSYGLGSRPRAPSLPHGEMRYAVVFLDNQMPVVGGLTVVRTLRKEGKRDFVVGVTGNALLTDQQEFISAGADQ
jgi:osomolarity two-component system, sensor histidine kinase SLN1